MFMAVPSLYTEASNVIILLLLWSWQIFIGWFLHKGLSFQFLLRKKNLLLKFNHHNKHWTKDYTHYHFPQENSWAGRGQTLT